MERKKVGPGLIIIGAILFIVSLWIILPISPFYLASLFALFVSVVLIGVGTAFAKGVDKTLDMPRSDCYYCGGTGRKDGEVCPRCGGSGISPSNDE